jgi:very-short-patch-repair endonuclease
VARVDFAYPDAQVAIEVDGLRYHASRRALEADAARQNEIALAGFQVVRFSKRDLDDPTRVATKVRRILRKHSEAA